MALMPAMLMLSVSGLAQDQAKPSATAAAPLTAPSTTVQADTTAPSPAVTEAESPNDVVVTAQRRQERAQDVPISLTALSAAALEKASINNVLDLPRVTPSLSIYRGPQTANTRLSIRGIGSAGNAAVEPSVGAYVDGIYIPRPGPLLAGLNDIASVEVLRGPQGTLFGRNASVGALSFRTTEPTNQFEGNLSLEQGSYNRWRANGVVNLPVNDKIATRFSVLYDNYDGYGFNIFNGERFGQNRLLSFRGAVRANITPNLRWVLRGDYQSQRGDGLAVITVDASTVTPTAATNFATRLKGLQPRLDSTFSYSVRQTPGGRLRDDQGGLASNLSLNLGDYTVRLLSGYRDWKNRQDDTDISLTAANIYGRNALYRSRSHSEELQLVSPSGNRLNFVGGLYYFYENYHIGATSNLQPGFCNILVRNSPTLMRNLAACLAGPQLAAGTNDFVQHTTGLAAYGQATYKILPQWDFTLGLRYSHDSKDAVLANRLNNPAFSTTIVTDDADLKFNGGRVTYRVNTTYHPFEDVMLYATVSSGYKSGGFDSGFGNKLGQNRVFRPETTTNYEIGYKTQFFDRRLTINNTLFRMDIDDFQLRSYNGNSFSVRNAGSIRQQGVEFEVTGHPVPDLTLGVSATRLGSKYTDFANAPGLPGFGGTQNLTGRRAPYSPKWQGIGSIDYRHGVGNDLAVGLNTRVSFVSDTDIGAAGDNNPQGIQQGYALLGARLSLFGPDDRWEIAVSGENLTDKGYCTVKYSQAFSGPLGLNSTVTGGGVQRCVLGEPRVLRASGKIRF